MAHPTRIRIVVMHAEHLVDAGLTATLARHADLEIVALPQTPAPHAEQSAERPAELLAELQAQRIDVVVADYDRGVGLARALQQGSGPLRTPATRVMIVTGRLTQAETRSALKLGVAGYLTSTCPSDEVLDAVRKVHLGMRHVSELLARSLLEDLLGERLTPRESEVLRLAAQGCANKVIAARLRVELGTVKCHMKSVLEKLRASNRTEAVIIASQRGLLALEGAREAPLPPAGPAAPLWAQTRAAAGPAPLARA